MDDPSITADLQARFDLRGSDEADLRAELDALWRVCRLHARVANEPDLQTRLEETIDAANGILGTDRGCIQLLSADGARLEMTAYRGYGPESPFIEQFRHEGSRVACDTVRQTGQRLVIEDVATFPALQGTVDREVGLRDGILAAQSTPMVTRKGTRVGVLSNQFRSPHRPTDAQLRLIDLLAWNAAEIVARHHTEAALQASERRLQRVLETDAVAVLFFDRQGVLTEANDAFLAMTGYRRDDVVAGRLSWQRLTPPEGLADRQAQMERVRTEGRIGAYEKECLRQDGTRAWMLVSGRDLGDGTLVELGIDITARKRAEAVLRDSESRLASAFEALAAAELRQRTLMEGIPQLVWRSGARGAWTWASPQWLKFTGQTQEQSRGQGWLAAIHPEDQAATRRAWEAAEAAGALDGSVSWVASRSTNWSTASSRP